MQRTVKYMYMYVCNTHVHKYQLDTASLAAMQTSVGQSKEWWAICLYNLQVHEIRLPGHSP